MIVSCNVLVFVSLIFYRNTDEHSFTTVLGPDDGSWKAIQGNIFADIKSGRFLNAKEYRATLTPQTEDLFSAGYLLTPGSSFSRNYVMNIPANKIRKMTISWSSFNAAAIMAGPMAFQASLGTQKDSIKIEKIIVKPLNGDAVESFCPKKPGLIEAADEVTFEHCH